MRLMHSAISVVILFWIMSGLCVPHAEATTTSDRAGIETFARQLVTVAQRVHKERDLRLLQPLIGTQLTVWHTPAACHRPLHTLPLSELHGWAVPQNGYNQTPKFLLIQYLSGLKQTPLLMLTSTQFNPYKPDACGSDDLQTKKPQWSDKWIAYPGDYLNEEKHGKCTDSPDQRTAQVTLLFFHDGDNLYFGLQNISGRWTLQYVGMSSDCDA